MIAGITGTRFGMTRNQRHTLRALLMGELPGLTEFHHGSCLGVDVEAARLVRELYPNCWIAAHPGPEGDRWQAGIGLVDDVRLVALTHFARNRAIVEGVSLLLACPAEMEEQSKGGTWYTIKYARKKKKALIILWPDGTLTKENMS